MTALGFVAQETALWVAFVAMAAAAGRLVVWFRVGETGPEPYID